ncbi:MAG: endonuclease VII domain-containing protein [Sphingobacteriaceae bacterium]|nr:endonuclease VII domain-containing protein [Sphingobacteriaceae bacterium]
MIKKKYYRENKNRHKEYSWKSNGIKDMTVERYNLLLIKQKYCCAICLTPNTKLKRVLAVDHDHKTGEVRGLLCDACNRALGYFKESQFIINNARTYLLCHKK